MQPPPPVCCKNTTHSLIPWGAGEPCGVHCMWRVLLTIKQRSIWEGRTGGALEVVQVLLGGVVVVVQALALLQARLVVAPARSSAPCPAILMVSCASLMHARQQQVCQHRGRWGCKQHVMQPLRQGGRCEEAKALTGHRAACRARRGGASPQRPVQPPPPSWPCRQQLDT